MQARSVTAGLIVSLVLALGMQAACGSPQVTAPTAEQPQPTQPPTTPPEAQQPTEEPIQEPTQEEQATEPPATADGETLLQDRCTECHGLDRTTGEQKTRDEWEQTVDRMIAKGAQLDEDERTALLDFLAQNYGP